MEDKLSDSLSDSSLSPPPDNLPALAETAIVKTTVSRKRKVNTTATTVTKRTKKTVATDVSTADAVAGAAESPQPKRRAAKKAKVEQKTMDDVGQLDTDDKMKSQKKVTPPKSLKIPSLVPMAIRTRDTPLLMGAHVSTSGGVQNAVINILNVGGNSGAFFLRSNRKWDNPELKPEAAKLFIEGCEEHGIDPAGCCLPHGSYLVNLAHPDPERKKQSYDCFVDDLARCHTLGIKLYNFHPGNANATTREEGIRMIAENINQAHRDRATGEVIAVLETMASQGNTIGGTFADIAEIIALVVDTDRVGVCLDTCHVFAAGYDLRTPEAYMATFEEFDKVIGLKYLKALHINDSKAPLFSNRDLHARIGTGYLGLRAFHNIVNDPRLHGLPMVLETPIDIVGEDGKKTEDKSIWAREIKLLESLVGMDIESKEFAKLEHELQEQGKDDRERIGDQVERKKIKDAKPKRASKKKVTSDGGDEPKPAKKAGKKHAKAAELDVDDEGATEKPSKKPSKRKDETTVETTVKQGSTSTKDVLAARPKRTTKKIATYADEEDDE